MQCIFISQSSNVQTVILTITVQVRSISLQTTYPDNQVPVILQGGGITQTQFTSSPNGQAQFIVPTGVTYKVTANDHAFGAQSILVSVQQTNSVGTITYSTSGLNVFGQGESTYTDEVIFGLIAVFGLLMMTGGFVAARSKPPGTK